MKEVHFRGLSVVFRLNAKYDEVGFKLFIGFPSSELCSANETILFFIKIIYQRADEGTI